MKFNWLDTKRDIFQIGLFQRWFFTIRWYGVSFNWLYWRNWIGFRPLGGWRFAIDILCIGILLEQYP